MDAKGIGLVVGGGVVVAVVPTGVLHSRGNVGPSAMCWCDEMGAREWGIVLLNPAGEAGILSVAKAPLLFAFWGRGWARQTAKTGAKLEKIVKTLENHQKNRDFFAVLP